MAWKKNSPEAIRRFDEVAGVPGAERKIMFGCPVYELHGERYAMLHENRVVLRLSDEHAAQLIAKGAGILATGGDRACGWSKSFRSCRGCDSRFFPTSKTSSNINRLNVVFGAP